eukprot:CAMPEP_0179464480 /NCGR_PEP_ID=MMETSP0799-20121207/46286_1 /TAXON_ID=46947 /ORGANISM="Geminigera cryophila, Strain CCMP2564" /LENGTH=36 /DNA_ID= /DNA_START= /DNA_END= /DNA_ORIENTATION=
MDFPPSAAASIIMGPCSTFPPRAALTGASAISSRLA